MKILLYSFISLFLFGLIISFIGFVFTNNKNKTYKTNNINNINTYEKYDYYPKTFFIDIDGTILKNYQEGELDKISKINGYIEDLLPSAKDFFNSLNKNDVVIFTTGRRERHRLLTERTLKYNNINYKHLIMDLPWGQRYLINDTPNMLYQKAVAINLLRNKGFGNINNYDPKS
jgi:ABC-type transport system involved in multi-copper enzyme maturation permease subunit